MLKTLMPSLKELITADYKTIKSAESERIISSMLKNITPVARPVLRQVSGIPGAGKSTYCRKQLPENFLYISFDKIMTTLSGYQNILQKEGAEAAYRQYEMPARIIGYELLRRALKKHLNIMFEHSGTNQAHLEMMKNLPKKGYTTAVDCIVCKTDLALVRSRRRTAESNRYVPENLIRERAANFKHYMNAYQKIATKISYFDGGDNFRRINEI